MRPVLNVRPQYVSSICELRGRPQCGSSKCVLNLHLQYEFVLNVRPQYVFSIGDFNMHPHCASTK